MIEPHLTELAPRAPTSMRKIVARVRCDMMVEDSSEKTMQAQSSTTTQLLSAAGDGDRQAAEDLLPLLYGELRRLAEAWMVGIQPGHTLQPTALVHDAYVRLVGNDDPGWDGRRHFFFAAARAMRQILIEHARNKASLKRGGGWRRVDAGGLKAALGAPAEELLALDDVLEKLSQTEERKYQVVMLRFFAGLSVERTAELLSVDARTVARDWRVTRAWLFGQLVEDKSPKST